MSTPIERMIDEVARCNTCGGRPGRCEERCFVARELTSWARTLESLARKQTDEDMAKNYRQSARRFRRGATLLLETVRIG